MSYQEQKSKNFAKYCKEGKMHLVKRWFDNPNVDINWNRHSPLRYAVRAGQTEVVKLILTHSKLTTDYENDSKELKGSSAIGERDPNSPTDDREWIDRVVNPFTEAMIHKHFEILDIFIDSGRFMVYRDVNFDVLVEMQDEELTDYFRKKDMKGFLDFVNELGGKYLYLMPEEVITLFVF